MSDKANIKSTILSRIESSEDHSVFFIGDFLEIAPMETVRKVLLQARMLGLLSHVAQGIYVKPMHSRFGEVPIPLESIAKAIAERDHVQIMPTGTTAANILGLSTQIPMTLSYQTTGSSRTVKVGKRAIKFQHAAPRNFAYKGKTIPLAVQAIREIGEKNMGDGERSKLHVYMSKAGDKDTYKGDVLLAPAWIQSILKPIIKKIEEEGNETLASI